MGNESERIVDPLGLVAKGSSWYLVAHTGSGRRTFRLDRVTAVIPSEFPVHRDETFDLAATWLEHTGEAERNRAPVIVHATCAPAGIGFLQTAVGENLEIGQAGSDGRIPVAIRALSEYGIAGHLAGLVEWLDIISPQSVRNHLLVIGEALASRYAKSANAAIEPGFDGADL